MKILMVNKFLHPNGGSETYVFKLGKELQRQGHEVQYFGMEHEGRVVGNCVDAYTSNMDFHDQSGLEKLIYSVKTIYSREARRKIREVLDAFAPDVCHLNNFNYQLTPSIILEIVKWRKEAGKRCKIVYTAHDYQLVCPNHMCRSLREAQNCDSCLGGKFLNCVKGKCIHNSLAKSAVGAAEAFFWNTAGVYRHIDTIVCCSGFMKTKLDVNPVFAEKTVVMHNFVDLPDAQETEKKNYVLYFGRFSKEKGIASLIRAAQNLPDIPFVFAGSGPLEDMLADIPNIRNVGFQSGRALETWIREARFTVYPSEWYENCPFSIMESQFYGTPVLGADIGGIPELIQPGKTGLLFESGNEAQLTQMIRMLWEDAERTAAYSRNCSLIQFDTTRTYVRKLTEQIYS